jgi:hypothetical protein
MLDKILSYVGLVRRSRYRALLVDAAEIISLAFMENKRIEAKVTKLESELKATQPKSDESKNAEGSKKVKKTSEKKG